MSFHECAKNIRVLVLDVDGVLTDAGAYYDNQGTVSKRFNIQDGLGIRIAQQVGLIVAVITGQAVPCVATRMKELEITDYYSGRIDKRESLEAIRAKYNCSLAEMAYLGDDWVDLSVMQQVGLPMAVANAQPEVKELAKYISPLSGGHGAVREVIMRILDAKNLRKIAMQRWME